MTDAEFAVLHGKLKAMRFSGMAAELKRQFKDPQISGISPEERITQLIMAEDELRHNKKLSRILKSSHLRYPEAVIDPQFLTESRGMDRTLLQELIEMKWMDRGANLIITGPCGSGKSYFACALAYVAVKDFKKVFYTRCNLLMAEIRKAESEGQLAKKLKDLQEHDLLILDDFGMMELNIEHCRHLFEVLDCRDGRKSTIFISQYPVDKWYGMFTNATYAEACLDRALHRACRIQFRGDSLRSRSFSEE